MKVNVLIEFSAAIVFGIPENGLSEKLLLSLLSFLLKC